MKKAKDAPTKLAYHMTDEETNACVEAEVNAHFALKQPLPKMKIDSKTREHFVDMLERPPTKVANLESDYDYSIHKSYMEMQWTRSNTASGKKVPQLGEQEMQ
jgi:hypothetical protein